jgi:hypothetical protein
MSIKYTALETIFSALTTELNSLADGSACTASSAFDNDTATTARFTNAMVEIYIATQGTNRAVGASVSLYVIPTTDGTSYGDATAECLENYRVGTYSLDDTATAARYITGRIQLPPVDYKVVLKNDTGQALAASGNTVKFREFGYENV